MIFGSAAMLPEGAFDNPTSITASAEISGDFEYRILDDGTIEITKYKGNGGYVVIPSTISGKRVTSIGDYAFYNCEYLTSVTIPSTITTIKESAFCWCTALSSVTIPEGVTSIGSNAFSSCSSLISVTIPNSVTEIGYDAFSSCKSLKSVTILEGVTSIGFRAFESCSSLTSVTIPNSVKSIKSDAFRYCTSLESVKIPSSVTEIGSDAFLNTKWLENKQNENPLVVVNGILIDGTKSSGNVILPDNVTCIGVEAFTYCKNLTSITIPGSVTSIGFRAFDDCTNLKSVTMSNGISSIGEYAFAGCESLTNISLPNSITSIGKYAFRSCKSLSSLALPDSITSISIDAFNGCSRLTSVTIPNSVTSIGEYAFAGCESLTNISLPNSITSIGYNAFFNTKWLENKQNENPFVIVNGILIDGKKNSGSVTIPSSVSTIGAGAFRECASITSVTIPYGTTRIEQEAFCYCENLTSVIIPNSVTSIGDYAFYNFKSLTSITIPNSVTSIGKYAFGYIGYNYSNGYIKNDEFSIKCYKNTAGEKYAIDNGFDYEIINEEPISITNCTINLSSSSYTYDGKAKTPSVMVKYGSKTLVKGTDYAVAYKNNVNAGTATVTVTGKGSYTGSVSKTYKIVAANISGATISGVNSSYTYTGKAIAPAVSVELNGKTLVKDTDYTVSYKNNVNVGTATITVTGKGNYTGTGTKTFKITATKTSISGAIIHGPNSSYTYTGKAIAPAVTVELNGKYLTKDTDYTVSYKNNVNVGTATITVTGKGNYKDTATKTFKIVAATPSSAFTWGRDNWRFGNNDIANYDVNSQVMSKMQKDFNLSDSDIYELKWNIHNDNLDGYNGSCYGMTISEILAKQGNIKLSRYGGNDIVYNNSMTSNMTSVINMIQELQLNSKMCQSTRQTPFYDDYFSQKDFIEKLESVLKNNNTIVKLGYKIITKDNYTGGTSKGGHAVLAYGIEDCNYKSSITEKTYNKRVLIADPNFLQNNKINSNACLYYNSSDKSWIVPYWNGTFMNGHYTDCCYWNSSSGSNTNRGYISNIMRYKSLSEASDLMRNDVAGHYIAGLQIDNKKNDTAIVEKVKNTGNPTTEYAGNNGNGIARYDNDFTDPLLLSSNRELYALWNPTSNYTVSYSKPTDFSAKMDYESIDYYIDTNNALFALLKPSGEITLRGSNSNYNITMVCDDSECVTDWFAVTISGKDADAVTYKKVSKGYIVSSANLNNVTIKAESTTSEANAIFSTKYDSALIYEIDKDTIGVAVDTDNNGTYETNIKAESIITNRLAGSGRYETAAKISQAAFDKADTVVLAYGLNYADALAGVSLATKLNAPILLTNTKTLDATTLAEIKRLKAKNVIILGGTGAVGAEVETALKKEGLKTERIAGGTRFETATKIAEKMQALSEDKAPEDIFFVYAFNSADALSVSAVAAVKGAPVIYLKTKGELDDATAAYLDSVKGKVKNAYVIGGTGVISDEMMKKAGDAVGVKATRVFGKDRFETCVAVNDKFKDVLNGDSICVATGMDFPDALAGGVFAALNKAPLFLVNGKLKTLTLSDTQKAYLKTKAPQKLYVFGGTGAVPDSHVQTVAKASV